MEPKWIKFIKQPLKNGAKTDVYTILTKDGNGNLGLVKWYAPWRKYCFYPSPNTLFESDCLTDITAFLKRLMLDRKAQKQNQQS